MDIATALAACQAAVAASPGNLRVLSELAHVYRVMKQDDKARELNLKAADQGYADAQWRVGFYYQTGNIGLPKDENAAARYFKLAAAQGHSMGQAFLGGLYLRGAGGLPLNAAEGARLLKLAAEQELPFAQWSLGLLFEKGVGVPRDLAQAAIWYRKAADQGNGDAQVKLGTMYFEGAGGLPHDDREAARLFRLAADQGNADAQNNLGFMYANGHGVDKDESTALYWWSKAAKQGQAEAKKAMAQLEARSQQREASNVTQQQRDYMHGLCALWAMPKATTYGSHVDEKLYDRWTNFCLSQMLKGIPCALFEDQNKAQCSTLPKE